MFPPQALDQLNIAESRFDGTLPGDGGHLGAVFDAKHFSAWTDFRCQRGQHRTYVAAWREIAAILD